MTRNDDVALVAVSGAVNTTTVVITLPSASVSAGRMIVVKDVGGNAGTNNIKITGSHTDSSGKDDIDGGASITLDSNYAAVTLVCLSGSYTGSDNALNGPKWFVY